MFLEEILNLWDRNKIAIHGERNITYGELADQVAKYRSVLAAAGVQKGDRVGLYAANTPDFIYVYFATVSLGAIIVPINFQLTDREVDFIVRDSGMKLVAAMRPLKIDCHCVLLQDLAAAAATADPAAAKIPAGRSEHDVCTLIYTSGTTGNPKGAMLTHYNLSFNVRQFNQVLPHYETDNVLCVLPMYHCFGWTTCVMNPLLRGGSITPLVSVLPSEIMAAIARYKVTIAFLVPPLYHLLARAGKPELMKTVRRYISGGASLPEPVATAFEEKFGKPILEGYGLSEASPVVAVNPEEKHKMYSIGPGVPDLEVMIDGYDPAHYEPGKIGELLVRGGNVMKGYWNLPEATAEALRGGWLHTGDMAYMDEDRYIYIVDRSKDMVIVNGENVYPREVEDAMYRFPGISEVAVVGHSDGLRGQYVCAYLVMKEGEKFDKQAMRQHLSELLAPFKMPREYVVLDALPKNSTGKILKRVLQESDTFTQDGE